MRGKALYIFYIAGTTDRGFAWRFAVVAGLLSAVVMRGFWYRIFIGTACCVLAARAPAIAQSSRQGIGPVPYADALGTGVLFRVWAPNATSLKVVGDFNGWLGTTLGNESNGYWAADVDGARHGQDYQYVINSNLWQQDPRGREIHGPNSRVYDPASFNWNGDSFVPPAKKDLVIYEAHIGTFFDPTPSDFSPAKFMDVTNRLDYLADLGINVIELMPVYSFPGERSWGYNPADLYATEQTYGNPDQLRTLIMAAHQKGIAVYLDLVHNHYDAQNSECDLWEFDGWTGGSPNFGGIYFYQENGKCCTIWGPRPHYGRQGVRDFIKDNVRMWLDEYRVDGFRWDSPINMKYYDGNYNADGWSLVREINDVISSNYPGHFSMGEDYGLDMKFHSEWYDSFHFNVLANLTTNNDAGRNMNTIANMVDYGNGLARVIYVENHDKAGKLNGLQRIVTRIEPGNPTGIPARRKAGLGAALTLTSPGVPLLFMGQEWFEELWFDDWVAMDWSKAADRMRSQLQFKHLIHLRRNLGGKSAGLRGDNVDVFHVNDGAKVIGFHRWDAHGTNDDVVVAMNFSSNEWSGYNLAFPYAGTWREHYNSDWRLYNTDHGNASVTQVVVASAWGMAPIRLAPYSAVIFSRNTNSVPDKDGDAMLDEWEVLHGLNPLDPADALLDPDDDQLTSIREFELGTDPNVFNALSNYDAFEITGSFNNWSFDGYPMSLTSHYAWACARRFNTTNFQFKFLTGDSWETVWGDTNQAGQVLPFTGTGEQGGATPAITVSAGSSTNDAILFSYNETNQSYTARIMPAVDADADSMNDEWELFYGLSPTNAGDAAENADGDIFSNLEEFQNGFHPAVYNEPLHDYDAICAAGTFNNWSLTRAPMKLWENYGRQCILKISAPTGALFKFVGNTNWAFNWGDLSQGSKALPLGQFGDWQGGDISITSAMNGVYLFRFNQKSVLYEVSELPWRDHDGDSIHDNWESLHGFNTNLASDASSDTDGDGLSNLDEFEFGTDPGFTDPRRSSYGGMHIPGSFNGWSPASNAMTLADHFLWESVIAVSNTGMAYFKFAANGNWTDNWGENDSSGSNLPLSGVAEYFGGDIAVNLDRVGDYLFTFDDRTLHFSVEFAPRSTWDQITVPGSFNGWDPTAYPMQLVDNYLWELHVSLSGVTNPAFKFVGNTDWLSSWGETNQPAQQAPLFGVAEHDAANIVLTEVFDGSYRFRFNETDQSYHLVPLDFTDADNDGMGDAWETAHGLDPNNPADATGDDDSDKQLNIDEFLAGTDPQSGSSLLKMGAVRAGSGGFTIDWQGGSTSWQYLEESVNGAFNSWQRILTNRPPTGVQGSFSNLLFSPGRAGTSLRLKASPLPPD